MIDVMRTLYRRDLLRLKTEIESYQDEGALWRTAGAVANSGGNLCLHLVGNLQTYIGAEFGKTGYVRDRPAEFARKDVPQAELVRMVGQTAEVVLAALDSLTEADLAREYPQLVWAEKTSTGYLLMNLSAHLTYHLGQINYHRRLLDTPAS